MAQCKRCKDMFYGRKSIYCESCDIILVTKKFIKKEHIKGSKPKYIILERDEFRCIYCGKSSIEDAKELHVDHIYPKSKGGAGTADNLVTACKECNTDKNAKILSIDIIERILTVIKERNKRFCIDDNQSIKGC